MNGRVNPPYILVTQGGSVSWTQQHPGASPAPLGPDSR